jgi:hypothetical protein
MRVERETNMLRMSVLRWILPLNRFEAARQMENDAHGSISGKRHGRRDDKLSRWWYRSCIHEPGARSTTMLCNQRYAGNGNLSGDTYGTSSKPGGGTQTAIRIRQIVV